MQQNATTSSHFSRSEKKPNSNTSRFLKSPINFTYSNPSRVQSPNNFSTFLLSSNVRNHHYSGNYCTNYGSSNSNNTSDNLAVLRKINETFSRYNRYTDPEVIRYSSNNKYSFSSASKNNNFEFTSADLKKERASSISSIASKYLEPVNRFFHLFTEKSEKRKKQKKK